MTLNCYCADTDKIITSSGQTTYVPSKAENAQQSFSTHVNARDLVYTYKREETPHRGQTLEGRYVKESRTQPGYCELRAINSSGRLSKQSASYFRIGRLS
jgi:hypothetical protein